MVLYSTIKVDATVSKTMLTSAVGTSPTTIRKATKELGLCSCHHHHCQFLSNKMKATHVKKGRLLLVSSTANE